jgi:hypothetical protein
MREKSGFGWTLLMLLAMTALLVGCAGTQDSSSDEMRAVVHADMNEVMSDVDAAMKSDPAVGMSSNPYDYVGISPAFERLVGRGEPALDAIASEIEASEENGLREYLLAIAGQRILGGDEPNQAWATGKEWAALYRSQH